MDGTQATVVTCAAVLLAIYVVRWYTDPINAIPTVGGSSLPGLSFLTAWKTMQNCREVLTAGYKKYPDSLFKIALFDSWLVVASGRNVIEEVRKRPQELSITLGIQQALRAQYIRAPEVLTDEYHVRVVKEKLSGRTLLQMLPDIVDEVAVAVGNHVKVQGSGWTSVEVVPAMEKIIFQVNNRAFVGPALCRSEEYLRLAIDFSQHTFKWSAILSTVPDIIRRIMAPFINEVKNDTKRAVPLLRPIIEERMKAQAELGEGWHDKPNDILQFVLDRATPKEESLFLIVHRMLIINHAASGNSVSTITYVLYHLAEDPELLQACRDEVEEKTAADGWTGTALGNMWKLDSILRETLRFHGTALVSMHRKATRDVVFSDGTRVPKGAFMQAAAYPLHRDATHIENPHTFDAFRYARMRSAAAEGEGLRHQASTTSPEYIPFGHGQHACPGRYFAAYVLKAILARLIVNYDLKLGGDGARPPIRYIASAVLPPPGGCVLLRKRVTAQVGGSRA